MKAQDLRIGNYYHWYAESKIYLYEIQAKDFCKHNIKNFEPIPLTEEWLLKFGFEKVRIDYTLTHCYHYQNEYCWIYLIHGGFEFEFITGNHRFNLMRNFEHVHQLQNLYFALTGQELTIKSNDNNNQ